MNKIDRLPLFNKENALFTQSLFGLLTIMAAVLLPQILHLIGRFTGCGATLGEIFLPMHLPILIMAFFLSPLTAAITAMGSILVSYLLSGMPSLVILPFVAVELVTLALSASFFNKKFSPLVSIIFSILISRAAKVLLSLLLSNILGMSSVTPALVGFLTLKGFLGISIHLTIVPLVVKYFKNGRRHERHE